MVYCMQDSQTLDPAVVRKGIDPSSNELTAKKGQPGRLPFSCDIENIIQWL